MKLKALMVDVDGVVIIKPNGRRWDWNLEADLGLNAEDLQQGFFAPHFQDVLLGHADLYERLAPVLADIAPHIRPRQLVEYWFAQDGHLNSVLLDDLASVRAGGVEVHLATLQEHHRARHLWWELRLSERFDAIHYAADLGCGKPDPTFFRAIEARTGFKPAEMLLLDDLTDNVKAAVDCGWAAALWDGTARLADVLRTVGVEV